MSDEVTRKTEALASAIVNSEEYQTLQKYEEQLKEKPDLRRKIDHFRDKTYRFQQQEGIDSYEEVDKLDQEFVQLRSDTLANAYLEAELAFCRMMQNIQEALVKNLDIAIPDEV